jgi:hypothetical protein
MARVADFVAVAVREAVAVAVPIAVPLAIRDTVAVAVPLAGSDTVPVSVPVTSAIAAGYAAATAGRTTATTGTATATRASTAASCQRRTGGHDDDGEGEHEDSIGCHSIPPGGPNRPHVADVSRLTRTTAWRWPEAASEMPASRLERKRA